VYTRPDGCVQYPLASTRMPPALKTTPLSFSFSLERMAADYSGLLGCRRPWENRSIRGGAARVPEKASFERCLSACAADDPYRRRGRATFARPGRRASSPVRVRSIRRRAASSSARKDAVEKRTDRRPRQPDDRKGRRLRRYASSPVGS